MIRLHTIDEETLAALCGKGNRSAQELLYNRYAPYMFTVCIRYCSSRADAEDLLQDGFIKIFNSIKSFRYKGKGSLKGWMNRVFINEAISRIRAKSRDISWDILDDRIDMAEETEDSILEEISPERLAVLISELPEGCRNILNLYVFEKKSHKEIAELMGIAENSSTSQYHRAKKLLKMKISEIIKKESL